MITVSIPVPCHSITRYTAGEQNNTQPPDASYHFEETITFSLLHTQWTYAVQMSCLTVWGERREFRRKEERKIYKGEGAYSSSSIHQHTIMAFFSFLLLLLTATAAVQGSSRQLYICSHRHCTASLHIEFLALQDLLDLNVLIHFLNIDLDLVSSLIV